MVLFDIFDPKAAPRPIGIDLGTTHSLVAYVRNGRPEAITDCNGVALLPSVVSYSGSGDPTVGVPAAARAAEAPSSTIASVKRFMGRGADDIETTRLATYRFLPKEDGGANVVRFDVGDGRVVTPVEVSAEILKALRRLAEDELDKVGGAVVTVPAYFDDAQRQATKDAARLAGLDVLRLLNEPTAAALAYGLEKKKNGTFAVYDLGGGTFDITILFLEDGLFQVKSTGGDSALGGDDMDRALAAEILRDNGFDPRVAVPLASIRGALIAAREAKHALTDAEFADIPAIVEGRPALRIDRARFDALIQPLLERAALACRRALKDAELKATDLDGVILVGGSTRVPAVRAHVEKLFGKVPLADIDPDKVVALGAALQADALSGDAKDEILLLDVIPLSLGIEVGGGVVDRILPRNATIPTEARGTYTTQEDNQTGFVVHVVQGERELAEDCRSLAHFTLKGIPPMPAGLARLEVTFAIDADGLLKVTARETTTGLETKVEVKPAYGLDDDTVEEMLLDAIDRGEEDLLARRLAEGRVEAGRILRATEKSLVDDHALLAEGEDAKIRLAMAKLVRAREGHDPAQIQIFIDDLDRATRGFAERRMNAAIAKAIGGKALDGVEASVAHAKGVEAAHEAGVSVRTERK